MVVAGPRRGKRVPPPHLPGVGSGPGLLSQPRPVRRAAVLFHSLISIFLGHHLPGPSQQEPLINWCLAIPHGEGLEEHKGRFVCTAASFDKAGPGMTQMWVIKLVGTADGSG